MQEKELMNNSITLSLGKPDLKKLFGKVALRGVQDFVKILQLFSTDLTAHFCADLFCTPQIKRKQSLKIQNIFSQASKEIIQYKNQDLITYSFKGRTDKTILLVHGWEGQAGDFYQLIPAILNEGYSIITFDGPAHGSSQGKKTTMVEFSEIINKIVTQAGVELHALIGHSFGGGASLLAMNSFKPLKAKHIVTLGSPNHISQVFDQFAQMMSLSPKVEKRFIEIIEKRANKKVHDLSLANMYSGLSVPRLVIHDIGDKIVSFEDAKEIIETNSDIELMQTSGLGHVRILHSKDVHKKIIDFIF